MKKIVVLFYFLICTVGISHVSAQINLVPNPSFEDTIVCTNGYSDRPQKWFPPTLGSPDRFSFYASQGTCFDFWPMNQYWGGGGYVYNVLPNSGLTYVGFLAMGTPNIGNREYLAVRLDDSLLANKKYIISYFIRLRNDSKYAIDAIGIAVHKDSVTDYTTLGSLNLNPITDHFNNGILSDTNRWVCVVDTITPDGGERYLYLGHFRSDDSTNYTIANPDGFNGSYYLVDDISVVVAAPESPTPTYPEIIMYPTPSVNGIFTIEYELAAGAVLEVYDMLGQLVANIFLEAGANQQTIALHTLAGAVYHYRVVQDGNQLKYGKLLIAK